MANIGLVGTQWGDEGKGKIVDILTPSFDIIARSQGGHNAGHTIIIDKEETILHLIPSGILYEGKKCVIGNGVVVDPQALLREIGVLEEKGFRVRENLLISSRAHLIFPYHVEVEKFLEKIRGGSKIGTTGRGIGPAYESKASREGLRASDLLNPDVFRQKIETLSDLVNKRFLEPCGLDPMDPMAVYDQYQGLGDKLGSMICDTSLYLNEAMDRGESVLFEGAQGTHLDIDHGTYPFVTSSNAVTGGICTGLGIGPTRIDGTIGISKAYSTRVGAGPFPTELSGPEGEMIQDLGREFGATTGRKRRCGWFDAVVVKYACRVNHLDLLAITKLDVLDNFDEIAICTGYRYKNSIIREFPAESWILEACSPEYITIKGWNKKTAGQKKFEDLPREARDYIRRIEDLVQRDVAIISTGAERSHTIFRDHDLLNRWLGSTGG